MYNFDEIIDRKNTNSLKYDKLKALFGTDDLLSMWVADMDFKTPDFVLDAIKRRAEHEVLGYSVQGSSFFESIINWMSNQHQWEIKKNWISFSPGVVPALTMMVMAYTQPGDKVIVQSPVYFPFFTSIENSGRQVLNNQLKNKDGVYQIDFEGLKEGIDSRTKMIILCNPHNPVGRVWTNEELIELSNICLKNDILIVSDEIHSDIIFSEYKHIPLASLSEDISQNTITVMAPSKTFNLAGLSSSVVIIQNQKLKAVFDNFIGNFHLNGGNIFGIVALEAAYKHGRQWLIEMIEYIEGNTDLVRKFAKSNAGKMQLIEPEATYLLWLDFQKSGLNDEELKLFMINKAKIGMNPGVMFGNGGSGFHRMNVACPRSIVQQALVQLGEALNSL